MRRLKWPEGFFPKERNFDELQGSAENAINELAADTVGTGIATGWALSIAGSTLTAAQGSGWDARGRRVASTTALTVDMAGQVSRPNAGQFRWVSIYAQFVRVQSGEVIDIDNVKSPYFSDDSAKLIVVEGATAATRSAAARPALTADLLLGDILVNHSTAWASLSIDDTRTVSLTASAKVAGLVDNKLSAHSSQTGPAAHGATPAPTAHQIVTRDASGRAQVAPPAAAEDIATKASVDGAVAGHAALNATATQTVHGIKQGAGGGFDSDKIDGKHWIDIFNAIYPVGYTYAQYPNGKTPQQMGFPGAWVEVFAGEGVFFRTSGRGAIGFNGGTQEDALQNHRHTASTAGSAPATSGAIFGYRDGNAFRPHIAVRNTSHVLGARTATETRPRNRTYRIWRRES